MVIKVSEITTDRSFVKVFCVSSVLFGFAFALLAFVNFPCKPAPRLTPKDSFNEKARWLNKHKTHCDVLVIGSSVALNDIDGPFIEESLPGVKLINAASWGQSITESAELLEIVAPIISPRLILFPLTYVSFGQENLANNWAEVKDYMSSGDSALALSLFYFRNMDLEYYIHEYVKNMRRLNNGRRIYDSLLFDESGGVLFDPIDFEIDSTRWNYYRHVTPLNQAFVNNELRALARIAGYANSNNIKLVFTIVPSSQAALQVLGPKFNNSLWRFVSRVSDESNILLLNRNQTISFEDSYFVDFEHLNGLGARSFSQILLPNLRELLGRGKQQSPDE